MLDRIDLHVEVPALAAADLESGAHAEGSTVVRGRVAIARRRQVERQGVANSRLTGREIDERARATA